MMKKKEFKKSDIVLLAIFIFMLYIPTASFFFLKDFIQNENLEKRELAKRPSLSISNIFSFPKQWDDYYNDHLPYRNIILNNWRNMHYVLFNESLDNRVIVGKDKNNETWLFYNAVNDGNELSFVDGRKTIKNEDLDKAVIKMGSQTKNLKEKGIDLYYIVAPNKSTIYKDNLPSTVGKKESCFASAYAYLRDKGVDNLYYSPGILKEAGEKYETYYRTDTHWNDYGSYVYIKNILSKVYGEDRVWEKDIKAGFVNSKGKDLHSFTGLSLPIRDNSAEIKYDSNIRSKSEIIDGSNVTVFENDNYLIDETVLIVGDSFTNSSVKHFSAIFRKIVWLKSSTTKYSEKVLDEYNPSKLFYIRVERYLPQALDFTFIEKQ